MSLRRLLVPLFFLFLINPLNALSVSGSESFVQTMDNLSSFKKLYISAGIIEVVLHQGNKSAVRLEGDKEVIADLDIKVSQGELDILYKNGHKIKDSSTKIKVDIWTKTLTSITARGYVDIKGGENWRVSSLRFLLTGSGSVDMSLSAKNLLIELSGDTQLILSGNADSQNVAITGAAKYDGSDLKTMSSTVVLSGAGSTTVFAKKTLDVTIYGSGDVHYKGSPSITQNVYGSGSIVKESLL